MKAIDLTTSCRRNMKTYTQKQLKRLEEEEANPSKVVFSVNIFSGSKVGSVANLYK